MWLLLITALLAPHLGSAGRNMWLIKERVQRSRELRLEKHLWENWKALPAEGKGDWVVPKEGLFPQPLDHFNRRNNGTFQQRYWVNAGLWEQQRGPVFLFIGGEGALTPYSVLAGEHVDLARKYRALLVSLEHRYYGASINPDGLSDQNIQLLSSQQALADLATFHEFIKQQYALTRNNRWICFGGSYPGSLSAWFRLKFPHLVFAAVASSAPVRAQLDFTGYNEEYMDGMELPCVDNSHRNVLEQLRSTEVKPFGVGVRQWYYQTCGEFGYYQTCEDKGCPFSRWLTLRSQVNICAQVFGIDPGSVQAGVNFTNDYYGADHPASSRIIFVNDGTTLRDPSEVTSQESAPRMYVANLARVCPPIH
ncbi:hypothetical protein scyTo_0017378 [Scyliorhinus torazame]|uniref:Thymus-specific serine protease n=1 Tax=Scyliorhinus torazame TaxID=75743 RepID=A0A401PRG3_SCYTO|nr:hypothetical protein [Scyliorhinus torazame]